MQKLRLGSLGKICFTLMSLTLLTHTVFGYSDTKVSYLDSVSSSYLYETQTNEGSILNVNSIDARAIETTLKLDSAPTITNSDTKINLSLRDSDLRQALRMLADKAKLNIVFDESVEGKITLDLNDITLNDAFMVIFKSTHLTYTMNGNTITVMTLEASKELAYTRQTMTVLPIKYVNAESVAAFLNNNLFKSNIFGLSNQPVVTSNPRTNQIVIVGTMADVNAIKRVLPVIDTKPMVNSFKVNHTTPKEMANLICNALFYSENSQGGSGEESDDEEKIVLGSGTVACRDTGSAEESGEGNLKPFKTSPLTITYFTDLGKITAYGGSVEQIEVIKEFIKEHDKKQLMAYVELSVIELNESGSKEFENEWNLWTPFISLGFSPDSGLTTNSQNPFFIWGNSVPQTVTKTQTVILRDKDGNATGTAQVPMETEEFISKSNNKALIYKLRYLINNGNGRVLTNPKIMVTNGKKATIDMTSDYVKSVTSQILQGSDTVTSATQRTYDIGSDEGLLIEITPFISPDGYVSMNISPEFATVKSREYARSDSGATELAATLLQRRDLQLKNIRIKDGETLVLAGLIKETETQTTKKMPVLSDLPFIGVFFRGNSSSKTREELVIVVTPHIVKDGDNITGEGIYDL